MKFFHPKELWVLLFRLKIWVYKLYLDYSNYTFDWSIKNVIYIPSDQVVVLNVRPGLFIDNDPEGIIQLIQLYRY